MSKEPKGSSLPNRTRYSLAFKLNLSMLGRLLSAFTFVNTLLFLLLIGFILYKAEVGAQKLWVYEGSAEFQPIAVLGYSIEEIEGAGRGFVFPEIVQEWLPLNTSHVRRRVAIPDIYQGLPLFQRVIHAEYQLAFTQSDATWQITYDLSGDIRFIVVSLIIIIGFELLYVLRSTGENARVIQNTLKPLSEMAQTARSLREGMAAVDRAPDGVGLRHLAGAISSIDAKQLDRRLSVDSSQDELKDLAHAINDMLKRISQSYDSQVRFVSDASHELRTPISVIQGYANLLDRWGKHDEKTLQEAIDAIKGETDNMKVLVEQLLFLARGDNETIHLHRLIFDCCDTIDEVIRETRLIDSAHIFQTKLERPAFLEADQQLMKQAIRILVDNSIKYTPAGEEIVLRVINDKDTVKIVVQDNGIGIAPEDVPYVFDRFYRSDESRARRTGGSGLGLAIAKWIVERHGGYFEVLSRVDIGTRTTMVLPSADLKQNTQ